MTKQELVSKQQFLRRLLVGAVIRFGHPVAERRFEVLVGQFDLPIAWREQGDGIVLSIELPAPEPEMGVLDDDEPTEPAEPEPTDSTFDAEMDDLVKGVRGEL